jgi:putative ATPase
MSEEAIEATLRRALAEDPQLAARQLAVVPGQLARIARAADGDARRALNLLEIASDLATNGQLDDAVLGEVLGGDPRRFDKGGDIFYDQISALHKAVRGGSPDASLYWLARMLDGGCDALYIARRVVRMATEDIGNADPRGLDIALSAWDTQQRLGSPEGELAIAQAVTYLACAAKSNAVYKAFGAARAEVESSPGYEVPMHLRNAPTRLMKDMDFGAGYRYAHDEPEGYAAGECYFPPELVGRRYYFPVGRGLEKQIGDKLDHLRARDAASKLQRYARPAGERDD